MSLLSITSPYAGKKLSKNQLNLLVKLSNLNVKLGTERQIRQNPYSGKAHELDPLAVSPHDFIIYQYHGGMVGKAFPISVWDKRSD